MTEKGELKSEEEFEAFSSTFLLAEKISCAETPAHLGSIKPIAMEKNIFLSMAVFFKQPSNNNKYNSNRSHYNVKRVNRLDQYNLNTNPSGKYNALCQHKPWGIPKPENKYR